MCETDESKASSHSSAKHDTSSAAGLAASRAEGESFEVRCPKVQCSRSAGRQPAAPVHSNCFTTSVTVHHHRRLPSHLRMPCRLCSSTTLASSLHRTGSAGVGASSSVALKQPCRLPRLNRTAMAKQARHQLATAVNSLPNHSPTAHPSLQHALLSPPVCSQHPPPPIHHPPHRAATTSPRTAAKAAAAT